VIAYLLIFWTQYSKLDSENQRLTVLSTRTALFLPLYAILMYISLCAPIIYVAMTVPITMIEGYSFYCFFTMIVTNLGGPEATVNFMRQSGKGLLCCTCCCPTEQVAFYKKATWALFHFFFTRSILIFLSAICFYSDKTVGKALYVVFSLVSFGVLIYGLGCLVLLYENVFSNCKNLFGIMKLLLLKFSVGMIVLEGLIEQFLVLANAAPYNDDSLFTTEEKAQRGYCALVLLEFAVVSVVYFYAYSYKITAPPANSSGKTNNFENLTLCGFVCEIMSFRDVFGLLTYTEGDLNEPLTTVQNRL